VSIRELTESDGADAKGASNGVLVEDVTADGPAAKAGLQKGDIITEFDGERVRSVRQLTRLVQETPGGRTVQAAVVRGGNRTTLSVTPEEGRFDFDGMGELGRVMRYHMTPRPPAPPPPPPAPGRAVPPVPPAPPTPPAFFEDSLVRSGRMGLSVSSVSSQLAEYFGVKAGVLVTAVADGSAAAKIGLKAGDVITSFNGSTVETPADVRRLSQRVANGDALAIEVVRDRKPIKISGKADVGEQRPTGRTIL
jgi:serine protease Do